MNHVATLKDKFLESFYLKGKRSIAKARAEGPGGLRLPRRRPAPRPAGPPAPPAPGPGRRGPPGRQALQGQGRGIPGRELRRPHGPALFAHGRHDARPPVLQRQRPRPLRRRRLDARSALQRPDRPDRGRRRARRPDDPGRGPVAAPGGVTRPAKGAVQAYLVNHNADNVLATFRFAHKDLKIQAAEKDFEAQGRKFRAGSFVIKPADNPGEPRSRPRRGRPRRSASPSSPPPLASRRPHPRGRRPARRGHAHLAEHPERGLAPDRPRRMRHPLRLHLGPRRPRQRQAPRQVRRHPVRAFLAGPLQHRSTASPATSPCPGRRPTSPRTSASRTRPTTCAAASSSTASCTCAISSGTAASSSPSATARRSPSTSAWPRGWPSATRPSSGPAAASTRRPSATGRARSPTATTTSSASTSASRPSSPWAARAAGPGPPTAPASGPAGRVSGRGSASDPDVVQGRPRDLGQKTIEEFRKAEKAAAEARRTRRTRAPAGASAANRPAIVLSFASGAADLLISGGLAGGEELAGSPALVDAAIGKGHVVLFSFNPAWRSQTHGSYFFIFNALLNWKDLGAKPK
ncbi:MAG: hypothetical protein M0C28_12925 [Candidatus Moduliflexus flocculans]|nr:hypothetical protein [Candidatus Moduliflexus flocculans]